MDMPFQLTIDVINEKHHEKSSWRHINVWGFWHRNTMKYRNLVVVCYGSQLGSRSVHIQTVVIWNPCNWGAAMLMWGALLRAGEFLAAFRSQLSLPRDAQFSVNFALVSIPEPKTRLTAARHQVAKLDIPDLIGVVDMAFGSLKPEQKLWQGSGQTLRNRLKQILCALHLPVTKTLQLKPLDLGSLRSGGATWLISTTEQSDLVMRRGRWLNAKTMSIYLQESMAVLYLQKVPPCAKERVLLFAAHFPKLLTRATGFQKAKVPTSLWNNILQLEKWQYVSAKLDGRVGMEIGCKNNLELVTDPEGLQNNWPCLSWWPLHPRLLRCCSLKLPDPVLRPPAHQAAEWDGNRL